MGKSICLDVDGVIADIAGGINRSLEKMGIVNYDYSHWLTTYHDDDLILEVMDNKLFWKNLKPFDDAWYQINNWWSLGYDIYLVTSRRSESSQSMLPVWLDEWKIQYNRYYFTDMGAKIDVIKDLDPLFVVEDNYNEIKVLTENGVNCFMRRAWYNSEYWEDYESIGSLFEIDYEKELSKTSNVYG